MMNVEEIQQIIPHRHPFLLIDRILEYEEGRRAVGVKNVTANEPYFEGHFPGHPVMPGVLMIEAMAQVGGVLLLAHPDNIGKLALFAGMDKVRFRKTVVPGDRLISEVIVLWNRGPFGRVKAIARVDEAVVAEGELIYSLVSGEAQNGK